MADKGYFFKTYSVSGEEIFDSGYYQNAVEFIHITNGRIAVSVGTEVVEAGAGDIIFIPASMVFRVRALDRAASLRGLVFDLDMLREDMENFDSEIFYMFDIQSRTRIAVFSRSHPIYERLAYCISEAYEEYVSKDVCFRLPVKAHIYLIISHLLRFYAVSRDELDRMIYHNVLRLRPVIEYINEHYSEKIYIDTLAGMITVSPDYFTKMFKDSIGTTPIDYINAVRVNHSLRLLAMTDTPINEISENIGFSNPNYFHKIFKSYMNTSPLAYRKSAIK